MGPRPIAPSLLWLKRGDFSVVRPRQRRGALRVLEPIRHAGRVLQSLYRVRPLKRR